MVILILISTPQYCRYIYNRQPHKLSMNKILLITHNVRVGNLLTGYGNPCMTHAFTKGGSLGL